MATQQVMFIDGRVTNAAAFIATLDPQTEWHWLDPEQDGLSQITRMLAGRHDLGAIHLVTHGRPGALQAGATLLDRASLSDYAAELAVLGSALSANGDLLLYGCDVAQGEDGRAFVAALAAATGADVAASEDMTGPVALGGDGVLEHVSGVVETTVLDIEALDNVLAANTAPTFMGGGLVTTDFGGSDSGQSVAVQADGKILVAGYSSYVSGGSDFALARYNANGMLDTSFSGDGRLTTDFGSSDYGRSVAVQADGKILVAGSDRDGFALARYTANGTLDTSFSDDGRQTTDFGGWASGESVVLQADGKILVMGSSSSDFALARYNANGTLDTSFSGDGWLTTDFGSADNGRSVALQADGKILMAGYIVTNGADFALARYNPDGTLDTSFSGDGLLITDFGDSDAGQSVAVQADGKILVAGSSGGDFALARYNTDGTLDTRFSDDGLLTTDFGNYSADGHSVVLQADGKILVAGSGYNYVNGDQDFALARYNTDGTLDTSFSSNGWLTTDFGSSNYGYSVTLQADGKILVAGGSGSGDYGSGDFALACYNADGTLDREFGVPRNTLDYTANYIEPYWSGSTVVALSPTARIFDRELSASGSYNGATLTLKRHGGANSDDVFSARGTLSALNTGNYFSVDTVTIGRVTTNTGGTLTLAFNTNATQDLVDRALQQIAYGNASDAPPAQVQIDWTFNDGNTGTQGTGGALNVTGSSYVNITPVNDAPESADLLTDQTAKTGVPFLYTLPNGAFTDPDLEPLTYSLSLANGSGLPPWLTIDSATGTVSGTPDPLDVGVFALRITARDSAGATTSDTFQLTVSTSSSTINGTSGNDVLVGTAGDDVINGLAGNDQLDGKAGNDRLVGGSGNDTYRVSDNGDSVIELKGEGTDLVNSDLTAYTLAANVENGRLMSAGAANLTGNALNNTLQAGAGNNVLDGAAGIDTVSYIDATAAVTVNLGTQRAQDTEGSGVDTLLNVECLTGSRYDDLLIGNSAANTLNGGQGADVLVGRAGNDILIGGAGNDILTGGLDQDSFVFNAALSATNNRDTITDFDVAADTIKLENAIFKKLVTTGTLSAANFVSNNAGVAKDANDYIVHDQDSGQLYYDADGNGVGAAIQFAIIGANLGLTNVDFVVT